MNDDMVQKPKEKKKGTIAIIAILTALTIGLTSYIIYDRVLNNENEKMTKEETVEETSVEKSENLDNVAQVLLNKLDKYSVDYYDYKEKIDFTTLDDKELIKAVYAYENDMNLTKSKVDEYFNDLFGKKLTNYPDYDCWAEDGVLYKYNINANEYEKQEGHGHGGLCTSHSAFMNYNNIEKNNEQYTITVTKIYEPTQGICKETPENAFYADSNYTVKIDELNAFTKTDVNGNWSIADTSEAKKYYIQNYEKFKNITPQYKYTFKKDANDNFYLTKYEKIK